MKLFTISEMVLTLKRSANWKWMAYWTRILPFWSESENVIYRQVVERSNCDDKGRSCYKKIGSAKWNFHVFDVILFLSLVIEGERPLLNQLTYSRPWRFTSREKESNIRDLNRLWSAWFELAWNFCLLLNVALLRLDEHMRLGSFYCIPCWPRQTKYDEPQNMK